MFIKPSVILCNVQIQRAGLEICFIFQFYAYKFQA